MAQPPANASPGFGPQTGKRQLHASGTSASGTSIGQQSGSGASGAAAQADFDSLIDLIESTVSPDSWVENGTGAGDIQPFPGGVLIDAAGTLRLATNNRGVAAITPVTSRAAQRKLPLSGAEKNVRTTSQLRYVSLPRLQRAIVRKQLRHEPLTVDMLTLAGLQRIEYVLVYPRAEDSESGDLVLAGPAGDWQVEPNGRIVAVETGQPVVRLDDLLVILRRQQTAGRASFGCSITPRQDALAATQTYLRRTGSRPLETGERGAWLKGLRDSLGKQDVDFFGIDPRTHVAQVLLAADYHMKLIGMGIVEGVPGVDSYLSTVTLSPAGTPPPMNVLRWWFTMKYAPVDTNEARDAYHIKGPGVQVLSENEMLAAQGRRVHTGHADDLTRRFAASFTSSFEQLSQRYPIYAELRNLFDLALVAMIFDSEGLIERIGWQPSLLLDSQRLRLPLVSTPRHVETVINHRVLRGRHIVAGVSGGVSVDAMRSLNVRAAAPDQESANKGSRFTATVAHEGIVWWWD